MQPITPERSATDGNRALDNHTVQNNSTRRQIQGSVTTTRRRLTSTIGHGMLPLSEGLSNQEYERRRQHNSRQAEENKKEQRERNNEAARRSRQRRADLIADQKAEIDRLKQENGALQSERDYWKGIVIELQGHGSGGGGANSAQRQQQQQQYLAYPAGMAPSVPVTPFAQMSAQQMPNSQMPSRAASSQMTQYPNIAQSGQNLQNPTPAAQTAPAISGPAGSNTIGGFEEAEFFRQLEQYSRQVDDGEALDNFDFSVPGNGT